MIDRFDLLTVLRPSYDDAISGELVKIKCVQRLAAFHQNIVRDVDNVVDRGDADRCQSVLHPRGARTNFHAFNHASDVPRAHVVTLDRYRGCFADRSVAFRRLSRRNRQFVVKANTDFTSDPDVPQAVRSIAGDFQIDRQIVADLLDAFEVQPGHHELICHFRRRCSRLDIFQQPVPTDDHNTTSND